MSKVAPVVITLNPKLAKQAHDLKLNLSKAAEDGIAQAIRAERERLWRLENAQAIETVNAYVDEHGLPLEQNRQF